MRATKSLSGAHVRSVRTSGARSAKAMICSERNDRLIGTGGRADTAPWLNRPSASIDGDSFGGPKRTMCPPENLILRSRYRPRNHDLLMTPDFNDKWSSRSAVTLRICSPIISIEMATVMDYTLKNGIWNDVINSQRQRDCKFHHATIRIIGKPFPVLGLPHHC